MLAIAVFAGFVRAKAVSKRIFVLTDHAFILPNDFEDSCCSVLARCVWAADELEKGETTMKWFTAIEADAG